MFAAGKARIVAAQKARWAKIKGAALASATPQAAASESKPSDEKAKPAPKKKSRMSKKPAKK